MNRTLNIWYGHWNIAINFGLWFDYIQFDACITIVPIGIHPGLHMNFSGGFFRIAFDVYYCDHDHDIPAPAEQSDRVQEDSHTGRDG